MRPVVLVSTLVMLAGCASAARNRESADTIGVFGVITTLGSVHLNGLRIGTDGPVEVRLDGIEGGRGLLRPGQVVAVVADEAGGGMQARSIDIWHAVSGPVEGRLAGGGILIVAGQTVRVDSRTRGDRDLSIGDWVEVSGLRDLNNTVVASRLDRRRPGMVVVSGRIERAAGEWRIGRLPVVPPPEARADIAGAQVVLAGDYASGTIKAHTMIVQRDLPFPAGPRHFVVQAYTRPHGPNLRLGPNLHAEGSPPAHGTRSAEPAVVELRRDSGGALHAIAFLGYGSDRGGEEGAVSAGAPAGAAASSVAGSAAGLGAAGPTGGSGSGGMSGASNAGGAANGAGHGGGSGAGAGASGSGGSGNGGAGNSAGGNAGGKGGNGNGGGGNGGGGHGGGRGR